MKAAEAAAEEFLKFEDRLDVIVNNAGVMLTPKGSKNDDGVDMQFGTNVLSPFAFNQKLFPILRETAKNSEPGSVRIIWVSSSAHFQTMDTKKSINFESIVKDVTLESSASLYGQRWVREEQSGQWRSASSSLVASASRWFIYSIPMARSNSKLANIQVSNFVAQELKADGVLSISLHPGVIRTELTRHLNFLVKYMLVSVLDLTGTSVQSRDFNFQDFLVRQLTSFPSIVTPFRFSLLPETFPDRRSTRSSDSTLLRCFSWSNCGRHWKLLCPLRKEVPSFPSRCHRSSCHQSYDGLCQISSWCRHYQVGSRAPSTVRNSSMRELFREYFRYCFYNPSS